MLGAVAAGVLLIGSIVVATRPSNDVVIETPAFDVERSPTTTETTTLRPASTLIAAGPQTTVAASTPMTAADVAEPDPTVETTPAPTTMLPVQTTAAPATTALPANVSTGVIRVPLVASAPAVIETIATVPYGAASDEIEVLNGEFPPPAVWFVGGVLVLEDAPQTGLTGDGVVVQVGPDEALVGDERRITPLDINVAEPGGTPIGVRSIDGGGIVVVTVHDDDPRVRIRQYIQNPPGELSEFGEGLDLAGLGDSELRVTSEGVTWGGDVAIAPNESNPQATRPVVISDRPFGFSSTVEIDRPAQDGSPAVSWSLEIDFDREFPPGSSSPLVEPFGSGALFVVQNSTAQFARPVVVVLNADGSGETIDLDGWSIADVRPEGALLTRSTPAGLEVAALRPTS